MALRIRVRPRARADMLDIWNYIAAESERSAEKVLLRIGEVYQMLASQPQAGRRRPELAERFEELPGRDLCGLLRDRRSFG